MEDFTHRELDIISEGILALIHNACEAQKLVNYDIKSYTSIESYIKELQALNSKICRIGE